VGAHIIDRADLRERTHVFRDRAHAGAVLAEMLAPLFERRPCCAVLAIPAGGVPVAAEIAARLAVPLDVAVVSKVTLPWNAEVGYGAVAFDGSVLLNERLVYQMGLSETQVEEGVARTREKVARRAAQLRRGRGYEGISGSDVILVDDGLASGFTMRAALTALRAAGAATITVAVPTAQESAAAVIAAMADTLYCANLRSGSRYAVADAYRSWRDVGEDEAVEMLSSFAPSPET